MYSRKAFTLIELLVVIAIIAILAVVVVLTLNPAELLRQARDSNRLSDLNTINSAIGLAETNNLPLGNASTVYVSLPDPTLSTGATSTCSSIGLPSLSAGWTYQCAAPGSYRNVNDTGWIPIAFNTIPSGSPLGSLPVDPTNQSSSGLFYTYTTNGTNYEMTSRLESQKYQSTMQNDGGQYADLYEQGTGLSLLPIDLYAESQPIQLRGTVIASGNGTTLNLSLPAGTQAGDLAIIFAGETQNSISLSPSGWTMLNQAGGLYVSGWTFSKVLTSSDITAGSVTATVLSGDKTVFALSVFAGATGGIRETDVQEYGGSFTSPVIGPSSSVAVANTDAGLYFGYTDNPSINTINYGTAQQTINSVGAGVLNFQLISTAGSFTPTFSYSSPGNGYYQSLVIVKHP